jgi:hypothetical protein
MKSFFRICILTVLQVVIASFCMGQSYKKDGQYLLPDPKLTPGVVNPVIIADLSKASHIVNGVEANMCAKDFRTGPYRATSESTKKKVCREYGAADCPDPKSGEIDHLVPLEIGGLDSIQNLWWQPAPDYHIKDHRVEDKLPKLICSGKIGLKEAQHCIITDWVKCMTKIQELEASK